MANSPYVDRTALTGGAAGALDAINYADLEDGDVAFVYTGAGTATRRVHFFRWNASNSGAEETSTHPYVILANDAGGSDGAWEEFELVSGTVHHDSTDEFVAGEHNTDLVTRTDDTLGLELEARGDSSITTNNRIWIDTSV